MSNELTADEVQSIRDAINAEANVNPVEAAYPEEQRTNFGYPTPEEKPNPSTIIRRVMDIPSTTRVGNLHADEVGIPVLSLRTLKEREHIARNIIGNKYYADYFRDKAEILSATSLSKDAKLITLAVTQQQHRILKDDSKPQVKNTGWFSSKIAEGG